MSVLQLQTARDCLLMNSDLSLNFFRYLRLTPGAKKITMSLPGIIKLTNGRKIQGNGGCMDADTHCLKHTH